jgi:hypothetical protein
MYTKEPKSVISGKRGGREGDVMPAHPEPGYEVVVQGEGWAKNTIIVMTQGTLWPERRRRARRDRRSE